MQTKQGQYLLQPHGRVIIGFFVYFSIFHYFTKFCLYIELLHWSTFKTLFHLLLLWHSLRNHKNDYIQSLSLCHIDDNLYFLILNLNFWLIIKIFPFSICWFRHDAILVWGLYMVHIIHNYFVQKFWCGRRNAILVWGLYMVHITPNYFVQKSWCWKEKLVMHTR
jgi:hypothetical protein